MACRPGADLVPELAVVVEPVRLDAVAEDLAARQVRQFGRPGVIGLPPAKGGRGTKRSNRRKVELLKIRMLGCLNCMSDGTGGPFMALSAVGDIRPCFSTGELAQRPLPLPTLLPAPPPPAAGQARNAVHER